MLRRLAIERTDVSEETSASNIGETTIGDLKDLAVTILRSVRRLLDTANIPSSQNFVTLKMEGLGSSETSVITMLEDGILFCSIRLTCGNIRKVFAVLFGGFPR
jgi:hypothetical protein